MLVLIIMYILAVLFPPIPAFVYGGVKHGIANIVLCFLLWIPAVVHAVILITNSDRE
jgi:uncharacterized membrane protein YqaE (UPF0057 family)